MTGAKQSGVSLPDWVELASTESHAVSLTVCGRQGQRMVNSEAVTTQAALIVEGMSTWLDTKSRVVTSLDILQCNCLVPSKLLDHGK